MLTLTKNHHGYYTLHRARWWLHLCPDFGHMPDLAEGSLPSYWDLGDEVSLRELFVAAAHIKLARAESVALRFTGSDVWLDIPLDENSAGAWNWDGESHRPGEDPPSLFLSFDTLQKHHQPFVKSIRRVTVADVAEMFA